MSVCFNILIIVLDELAERMATLLHRWIKSSSADNASEQSLAFATAAFDILVGIVTDEHLIAGMRDEHGDIFTTVRKSMESFIAYGLHAPNRHDV